MLAKSVLGDPNNVLMDTSNSLGYSFEHLWIRPCCARFPSTDCLSGYAEFLSHLLLCKIVGFTDFADDIFKFHTDCFCKDIQTHYVCQETDCCLLHSSFLLWKRLLKRTILHLLSFIIYLLSDAEYF